MFNLLKAISNRTLIKLVENFILTEEQLKVRNEEFSNKTARHNNSDGQEDTDKQV
jgi:hypothetical protein